MFTIKQSFETKNSKQKIAVDDFCFENKKKVIQKAMIKIKTKRQKEYRILKYSNNMYIINFIIRYLHSSSKFETITINKLFKISILFSSIKSINMLSNSAIIKIAVEIIMNSMKFKKRKKIKIKRHSLNK